MTTTTFDDLFRGTLQKMPQLFVPLVNELFGTRYPFDVPYRLLAQQHLSSPKETVSSAFMRIAYGFYRIICRSVKNQQVSICIARMYTPFSSEDAFLCDGIYTTQLPSSGIVYLTGRQEEFPQIMVVAPDGEALMDEPKTINMLDYSFEDILLKSLYLLIPFLLLFNDNAGTSL